MSETLDYIDEIIKRVKYILMIDDDSVEEELRLKTEDVVKRFINYIDYNEAEFEDWDNDLYDALAKQVAYEYKRKKDIGLQSVTYPDGSINKYLTSEWLSEIKPAIDRKRIKIL